MGLLDRIAETRSAPTRTKDFSEPPFWAWDGLSLPLLSSTPLNGDKEKIQNSFEGYVSAAYKSSGIIFACIRARQMIFSEARFMWREFKDGRPQNLFGNEELALLENPWPGGTTGDLLARMEVTASCGGTFFATTADDDGRLGNSSIGGPGRRIVPMRPDWVTLAISSRSGDPRALDSRLAAVIYEPPPTSGGARRPDPVALLPSEVCIWAPLQDPVARWLGVSWITPIIEEIRADKAATRHKGKFFENGATLGQGFSMDASLSPEAFKAYVELFKLHHRGTEKAYETLFIGGGATPVNSMADFRQLEFTALQGRAETRIASNAGVHPTLVGFSEGLQGSSLNSGNFEAAARLTANITMRPNWRTAAAALQALVRPPSPRATLWYDDRDIAFLHNTATDLADIREKDARTLRALVDGGYNPDAAVQFVSTNDLNSLKGSHSGLLPVQLQPPSAGRNGDGPEPSTNGRANGAGQVALR